MWYIDTDGFPTNEDFPQDIPAYMYSPYPSLYWNISTEDNLPELGIMPDYIPNMTSPYPASMWYIGDSHTPELGAMPEYLYFGAFANATRLTRVTIPDSVKSVGDNSCSNTTLSSITLANDCTYYETSFPPNCTVSGGILIG